jgi:streptogramin lyase
MSNRQRTLSLLSLCLLAAAGLQGQATTVPAVQKIATENAHPVTGERVIPQPDGTVWFLVPSNDRIVQLQADGVTLKQWQIRTDANLGANPVDFRVDGTIIWFIENGESLIDAGHSAFGRLDTSTGQLREWDLPGSKPAAFAFTPDGKAWFPQTDGRIQSLDLNTLQVVDYRSTLGFAYADMVVGPDGAFWLADFGNNRIVQWKPGGTTETSWTFFDPSQGRLNPTQIRFDDKGLLWISQFSGAQMNSFDPATGDLVSYLGFINPIHFDIFDGRLYVAEAPDSNGEILILDPALASGVRASLLSQTEIVGSVNNAIGAKIMDSTITPTTFTATSNAFAATDLTTAVVLPGLLSFQYANRNAYGMGVGGGTVWAGSDGLLAKLVPQTIGNTTDLTAPVAAEFGVSPGVRITTDAVLSNRGTANIAGDILYLYSPGAFAASTPFSVDPGKTVLLSDALGGVSSNIGVLFGPVRVRVASGSVDDLTVTLRSSHQLDDGSSFGFSMPALSAGASAGQGATRVLFTGGRASEVSVFGFYTPGGASFTAKLLAPDGSVRGTQSFLLASNTSQEFNPAASAFGLPAEGGDVIVVTVNSGTLQPYVNVLDTGSFDVASSPAVAPTQDAVVPLVGTLTGLGDTSFVSDLFVANPDPSNSANVTVSYLPLGSTDQPASMAVPLSPGASQGIADVLGTLFGVTAGQGTLLVSSDSPVAVSARLASRKTEGDYAVFAPAQDGGSAIPDGATATAIGVPQTPNRRTHLVLYNRGADGTATVTGYDGSGNQVGQLSADIAAGQAVRIDSVMEQLGADGQAVGRLSVTGTSGMSLFAETVEVDADTGDLEIATLRPSP